MTPAWRVRLGSTRRVRQGGVGRDCTSRPDKLQVERPRVVMESVENVL